VSNGKRRGEREGKREAEMELKCRKRRLWCPCRVKGERKKGRREGRGGEIGGCWDSELASNGV